MCLVDQLETGLIQHEHSCYRLYVQENIILRIFSNFVTQSSRDDDACSRCKRKAYAVCVICTHAYVGLLRNNV